MKYLWLLWTNIIRNKIRAVFTLLSVIIAFLLYGLLAAVNNALTGGIDLAGVDRLMVMNRLSFLQPLPISYENRIAKIEGVDKVSHTSWVEAYYREPINIVVILAIEPETYLPLFKEIEIPRNQKEHWLKNTTGVAVGKTLSLQYGWQLGDRITIMPGSALAGPGNGWEFTVDAIYDENQGNGDTSALLMHYQYFNESRAFNRDTVWSYSIGVENPNEADLVAKRIDNHFQNSSAETKTWTEKAIIKTLVAQFGNITGIVIAISTVTFFTMLLVCGSTISESVRERRRELATFKAIGYTHSEILKLILSESVLFVGIGGAIGLLLAYMINSGLGVLLAKYMPLYKMTLTDLTLGLSMAVVFGLVTGWLPARSGYKMPIAHTLRAE